MTRHANAQTLNLGAAAKLSRRHMLGSTCRIVSAARPKNQVYHTDPFEAEAGKIGRDPAVQAIRLLLALYARRHRAPGTRRRPPPLPPPLRRCQCRPPRSADATGEDVGGGDAR